MASQDVWAHSALSSMAKRLLISLAVVSLGLLGSCIPKKDPKANATPAISSEPPVPPSSSAFDHSAAMALPSLAEAMQPYFPVGAAVEPFQLGTMPDILSHHFTRITAENAMKLEQTCATARCDFTRADMVADFARKHHWQMTGHALVWHQMVPAWFFREGTGAAPEALVAERLKAHTFQMVSRYADVIDNWDVVNEAISDQPGKIYRDEAEGSKWYATWRGEGYIKAAFEYAHRASAAHDPTVKLYYNDYNVVNPAKRRKIIEMVRSLRSQGVRIDGVGMQGHWGIAWPSIDEIETTIRELRAENLEVKVSELDISVYAEDDHEKKVWQPAIPDSPELEARLAQRYREIFEAFKRHKGDLAHVTFWGISDDKTWLNYWPLRRDNYPLLFDRTHQPKPALRAILGLDASVEPRATTN